MSNYIDVRKEAGRRGPISSDASLPISIQPSREFIVTRLIAVPVIKENGKKVSGVYMQHPALIIVAAFTAGEASARADEIQFNKKVEFWGHGNSPWNGSGSWKEVELPPNTNPLILR